ncbi:Predicted transcriptional regulator [Verrucomicrobium sp. GAS474]|uniref:BlaI/MecI/CopY family transcriptional regulator n=1 Tax=Verrucomicrobium sp. GAS474 TaxID=1882831 RepID=UPI0008799C44|nr:BlaI/MecI/CopY family transcriptional regulator [Verrucomicrobium sp. GAS474]SDU23312.1 Predicted transcriptional regulator [Verrucomicrobium sp. GAS474]
MSDKRTPPTQAELEILQALWGGGPQTVRQIWEAMGSRGGYTTTLKLLQIMFEKGLVTRDESRMTHIYAAAVAEGENQERMVGGMIDRVFGGSLSQLVLRALSAKPTSPEELAAIRALIDEAQKEKRGRKK